VLGISGVRPPEFLKFLNSSPDNPDVDELTREFLIESQEGLDRMERCLTELEDRPHDRELLAEIFRSVHTIKGTTGFLGYARLESLSHAGENLLGLLRDGKLTADSEIISALLALLDGLRAILASIEAQGVESAGDDSEIIARLLQLQDGSSRGVHLPNPAEPVMQNETAAKIPASAADSTLRVDIALLNRMMNLVGELVLTRNQILQATGADAGFAVLSRRLDMVTADLRESVMKARMQPVSHVFSKFPRLVRDLAQQLGKRVRLEMEGQDTELDKGLLEAIKDPLTHSVRNSIDHGIEAPQLRIAAGKPAEGILKLRAYQHGSHVIVEVADDGGGIRVDKVLDKAIERNLITPEKAAQSTERELLQLVFLPGFSTASSVTNVSGRGVGMDVVRNNVEKIGGKVEIESRAGRGTTLRLRIPLTLAIVPALILRSRGQSFALPQGVLDELVHLNADQARTQIEWVGDAPVYRLRARLLPLVFLDRLLEQREAAQCQAGCYIAVLNADGRSFGLVVDGLADPEEIVVKPLSPALKQIGLFSGATVMGNGEMGLILDPVAIAIRASISLTGEEQDSAEPTPDVARVEENEFLLVEAGAERAAVRLGDVLRIERIPRSDLERIGDVPVLRFEGALLPLADLAGVLGQPLESGAQLTVVVCRDRERHVGLSVSNVLDVASGASLAQAGTGADAVGVTLLKERATSIIDLSRIPSLQEVVAS
jgi:two-component system chemotaxis sensor kinase CheA